MNKRLLYVFIFGNISWTCSPCFELISYLCYSRHVSNTGLGFSLFFAVFLMLLRQFTVNCLETRVFDKASFPSFSLKERPKNAQINYNLVPTNPGKRRHKLYYISINWQKAFGIFFVSKSRLNIYKDLKSKCVCRQQKDSVRKFI